MTDYTLLPSHLREGVERWIRFGVDPGSFLRSVISNDLFRAVTRADDESLRELPSIVRWFIFHAPEGAFGSPKVLETWPLYLKALERQAEEFEQVKNDMMLFGTGYAQVTAEGIKTLSPEDVILSDHSEML